MASIDLSRVSVTQANELIRKCGADGEDIEVINPDARHHIGVGLVHKVRLHNPRLGRLFLRRSDRRPARRGRQQCGLGPGRQHARRLRGRARQCRRHRRRRHPRRRGVVHGNIGSRAGQVMKAGTLCCAGNAKLHGRLHDVWRPASSSSAIPARRSARHTGGTIYVAAT